MARQESLSILVDNGSKALLAEEYGAVIDNIQKSTLSNLLKNTDLSGDPSSGSVEAHRMQNTASQKYGTARSGGKGQNIKADPVTVKIDVDQELINEVENKDIKLGGYKRFVAKKAAQNKESMKRDLERAFFTKASTGGAQATLKKTTAVEKLAELILLIETTKNKYVDGVERDLIHVVCTPEKYEEIRAFLDTTSNSNVDTASGEFGRYHGAWVHSSNYLPSDTDAIAMVEGAVAQPVTVDIDQLAKFPASNAYHFGLFYSYGTECVTPDLIQVVKAVV